MPSLDPELLRELVELELLVSLLGGLERRLRPLFDDAAILFSRQWLYFSLSNETQCNMAWSSRKQVKVASFLGTRVCSYLVMLRQGQDQTFFAAPSATECATCLATTRTRAQAGGTGPSSAT